MARPIRIIYVGDHKTPEWQELTEVASRAAFHANGKPTLEVATTPSLIGDAAKKTRNLIPHTEYIYFPADLVDYGEIELITQRIERIHFQHQYKDLFKEINKKITRRLDNNMCVPCRVLDRKITQADVVHHVIYGEHTLELFTNMMTVCQDIPMSPATHHGRFHESKITAAHGILSNLRTAIGADNPYWRWEQAFRYYEARV